MRIIGLSAFGAVCLGLPVLLIYALAGAGFAIGIAAIYVAVALIMFRVS